MIQNHLLITLETIVKELVEVLVDYEDNIEVSRLFNWNCDWRKNGLTEEKIGLINKVTANYADSNIVILQECIYDDYIKAKSMYKNAVWHGDGIDGPLGICIFSDKYTFELLDHNVSKSLFRYVVPYSLKNENINITLFAVWTKSPLYAEYLSQAIDHYRNLLVEPVVLVGDFNSGDTSKKRSPEHLKVIEKLSNHNIFNCTKLPGVSYKNDLEMFPTFYHNYDLNKGYVDDYCFISNNRKQINLGHFRIGNSEKWLKYSDHCPLLIDLYMRKNKQKK